MSSDERIQKPDNINYKPVAMHNGKYRLRRVPLNNITGSTVTLDATATQLIEWKIPAGTVFNPARSFIDYQIELPSMRRQLGPLTTLSRSAPVSSFAMPRVCT